MKFLVSPFQMILFFLFLNCLIISLFKYLRIILKGLLRLTSNVCRRLGEIVMFISIQNAKFTVPSSVYFLINTHFETL